MKLGIKEVLEKYLRQIHAMIDFIVAALLLSGQITIRSVIVSTSSEVRVSISGPMFGNLRTEAVDHLPNVAFVLDALDVFTAFLLILGEINVMGVMVQPQRFSFVVGGPPFGAPKTIAYVPETMQIFKGYQGLLLNRYGQPYEGK